MSWFGNQIINCQFQTVVEKIWFSKDLGMDEGELKYSLTILVNLGKERIDF